MWIQPTWRPLVALITLALALTLQPACTVLVDHDAKQCSTDDDCRSRGLGFEGNFCSTDNVCTKDLDYCASNADCFARLGTNTAICHQDEHRCVELLTKECSRILGDVDDLKNDNAVVLGYHGIASWSPTVVQGPQALELARRDWKDTVGGLPPTTASNGQPRPLVWLVCDVPIGQQELHKTVTNHLINVVKVPGMSGPFATADFVSYAFPLAVTSKTPFITFTDYTPAYNAPGFENVYFSLGFPKGVGSVVFAKLVNIWEDLLKKRGNAGPYKVAVASTGTGLQVDQVTDLYKQLSYNGKSAAQNAALMNATGQPYYKEFSYGNPAAPNFQTTAANAVIAMKDYSPDILVMRGGDEATVVAKQVETANPGKTAYVFGVAGESFATKLVGTDENLRQRVIGFGGGKSRQDPQIQRFSSRFQSEFMTPANSLGTVTYDIGFMFSLAISSLGNNPVTGAGVGKALKDMFKGNAATKLDPTPGSIARGVSALQSGQPVAYNGLETIWEFDATNYYVDWGQFVWCVDRSFSAAVESGLSLNSREGLIGAITCF